MTVSVEPGAPTLPGLPAMRAAAPSRAHRSECDLAVQQVLAVDGFTRARRARERALRAATADPEERLQAARALDVLQRQHDALVGRTAQHLRDSGDQLRAHTCLRAVLAHRNAWFVDRLTRTLQDAGVLVVAQTDNGADAVGICVAEQPDLVLVEDTLLMLSGREVVEQARRFAPRTTVAAQVAASDGVGPLLDAGAAAVFTRQVPPADVAHGLLQLVTA